ncbi:MAG: MFS transporter [Geobacteraceae bacterium]|nr:MFS transporter [Geobacteraceae bacterium]
MTGPIEHGSARYHRANLALFIAGFVAFVTLYDVQPLLPLFSREFGVSPAIGSLPLSISTWTLAVAMLLAGTVSETVGRKPLISAALFLTSLMALLTYFCDSFAALLTVRFLQGLVLAGVPSVAMAYLGEEMDSRAITSAIGIYISGNAVGGMTGRISSAILSDHFPWRSGIALIGCLTFVLAVMFLFILPAPAKFVKRPFKAGYLLTSLLFHLKDRSMLLLFSIAFLAMGGFITLYNYITFRLLAPPYSLSQSSISLIFLVYFTGSLSSSFMGRLLQRFGRTFMMRLTIGGMLAGTLLTLCSSLVWIITGIGIFTCGFFGAHAIASGWVGKRATTARAQATSLYLFAYYQGSSISGTVGGIFWVKWGWHGITIIIITLLLLALAAAESVRRMELNQPVISG